MLFEKQPARPLYSWSLAGMRDGVQEDLLQLWTPHRCQDLAGALGQQVSYLRYTKASVIRRRDERVVEEWPGRIQAANRSHEANEGGPRFA